jgi:hypothetical protein
MDFKLKDVLDAVGPTASVIFASWIFMTFLQQRYTSAYDLYRRMIDNFREGLEGGRKQKVLEQIVLYKKRVETMRRATNLGLFGAILLILGILTGALDAIFKDTAFLKYIGAGCIGGGLLLVIASASLVIVENIQIKEAMNKELEDVPELADETHRPTAK